MSTLAALWSVFTAQPAYWLIIAALFALVIFAAWATTGTHDYPPRDPEPRLTPEQQRANARFPKQRIAAADQLQQQRNKGEAR